MSMQYACTVRVTIFSVGSKFRLILNFTELLALVLVTCSYVLLLSADSILFL